MLVKVSAGGCGPGLHRTGGGGGQPGQLGGVGGQLGAEGVDHQPADRPLVGVRQGSHQRDQLGAEGLKARRPVLRPRRQSRDDEVVELGGDLPLRPGHRRGNARAEATGLQLAQVHAGIGPGQRPAGQHLPEQRPHRVDVAGRRAARQVLGRNQRRGARAAAGQLVGRGRQPGAGVQQLHLAVPGQHHRRGRQPGDMGVHAGGGLLLRAREGQRLADLQRDVRRHADAAADRCGPAARPGQRPRRIR